MVFALATYIRTYVDFVRTCLHAYMQSAILRTTHNNAWPTLTTHTVRLRLSNNTHTTTLVIGYFYAKKCEVFYVPYRRRL